MTQPNVLFIFSDQHRWCDLGCYGNQEVKSPHIDAFARESLQFENCISNVPLCVPARASLLTGLSPLKHRAVCNDLPIDTEVESVAHHLNDAGYHTGYIGKWHLAGIPRDQAIPAGPGRLGFQEWKVNNCSHNYMNTSYYDEHNQLHNIDGYEPIKQTDLAIDFMERNQNKPWGLYLSWGPPHDPYREVPQKYLDMYEQEKLSLRDNVPDQILETSTNMLNKEQIINNYKGYYAHITALDEQFGRIIKKLEESGQLENTIVVYTSDHGDMLGSQGYTNKQLPYEESIKVPLLIYWKDKIYQGTTDEMIGLVDLPISLLGLLGVPKPEVADGQDLHRLFLDIDAKGLDECYIASLVPCHQAAKRGDTDWRGIRTRSHTFARTPYDSGYILYDNQQDPLQMNNLIDEESAKELRNQLSSLLDAYIAKHDRLLTWDQLIIEHGFLEEWNKSQAYFGLPILET